MRFWLFEKLIEFWKNAPLRAYNETRQDLAFPDREVFRMNLLRTQAYCQSILNSEPTQEVHVVFRSFNPLWRNHPLFHLHETTQQQQCISPSLIEWFVEPTGEAIMKMLEMRLASIQYLNVDPAFRYSGRILLAQMDCTVLDGASEAESQGLVDLHDLPPIDTWFHILTAANGTFLCAWIPEPYVALADSGVQVNMLDSMVWMDELLPQMHESLLS